MFKSMLARQTTFVSDVAQAEAYSPFRLVPNPFNGKWIVQDTSREYSQCVAAGMEQDEAEACVMYKANQYITRSLQNN